jgi:prevent-host-death family protein
LKTKTNTVGSYEAKTHLPALLARVEKGAEIVITRREKPIARLVPMEAPKLTMKEWVARARAFRAKHRLPKGETTSDLVKAGRRI